MSSPAARNVPPPAGDVDGAPSVAVGDEGQLALTRLPEGGGEAALRRVERVAAPEEGAEERRRGLGAGDSAAVREQLPLEDGDRSARIVDRDPAALAGEAESDGFGARRRQLELVVGATQQRRRRPLNDRCGILRAERGYQAGHGLRLCDPALEATRRAHGSGSTFAGRPGGRARGCDPQGA